MARNQTTNSGRRLKGARLTKVTHHITKREGWVMLDKHDMTFWAVAGDGGQGAPYFESRDGAAVEQWLKKELAKTSDADRLEWQPIVEVEIKENERWYKHDEDGEDKKSVDMEIKINRSQIALTKDGREWRQLTWEECDPASNAHIPENDRYLHSHFYAKGPKHEDCRPGHKSYGEPDKPFRLPVYTKKGDSGETIVPFTPELWAGLVLVVEQTRAARATLVEMLRTKAGLATVVQIGVGAMPLRIRATVGEVES